MKSEEDEAFEELARKQGGWGGGFKAKQAMAANKLWDKPSVAFDEWWNGDNDESTNPFRLESGAYWAWAGWKAALAQPAQELKIKSWGETHPRNPSATCVCEHWQSCVECRPTAQEPAQEPVAWRRREVGGCWRYFGWKEADMSHELVERWNKNGFECEAIPAIPPQREWVGLTAEEIASIPLNEYTLQTAERLLKEKNA